MFIVIVGLFYVLTPGILLRLPPKASPKIVALTHGVVFALVWWIIHKPLWLFTSGLTEGMHSKHPAAAVAKKPKENSQNK